MYFWQYFFIKRNKLWDDTLEKMNDAQKERQKKCDLFCGDKEMTAYAWLMCSGVIVTGEKKYGMFTVTGRFLV